MLQPKEVQILISQKFEKRVLPNQKLVIIH